MIKKLRKKILEISYKAKACHIGSALSCVEIILAIDKVKKKKDIFLFGKASGVSTYYCLLAEKGIIPENKLAYYLKYYPLASKKVPGIIHSVGSVGHGLSVAVGLAFADKTRNVYCLISDGDLNEGSTWEATLFASHHKLKNLIVVVDYNKLQACGKTEDILDLDPLPAKFKAFNWDAVGVDGHDINKLKKVLTSSKKTAKIVIAKTLKGKGVDFLENSVHSHYKNLDSLLLNKALKQL